MLSLVIRPIVRLGPEENLIHGLLEAYIYVSRAVNILLAQVLLLLCLFIIFLFIYFLRAL